MPEISPGLKTSLLTLYISPEERQLVGIALHEITVVDIEREFMMVMDKPIGDIWLPKKFSLVEEMKGNNLPINFYVKEFHSYSKSEVKAKFWFEELK